MDFQILGTLAVKADSHEIPIRGPKPRALLVLLLLQRNRTVSNDRLIDAIWGEQGGEGTLAALRVSVSRLRKALGDAQDRLLTEPTGYRLKLEEDELDADRFGALHDEGRRLLRDGDATRAAETLRLALSLWRGPAVADFADAPFALADATRLEEQRIVAIEDRVEAELESGEHSRLVGELDALTSEYPLRERLWAARMTALYRSGRQAESLRTYQQARQVMVDELGIEPGAGLRRLEAAILRQDDDLAAPSPAPMVSPALRLMLVDDHPMWRDAVRSFLEHKRIAEVVAEADDGRTAVDLAEQARPDVVVMDLHMPNLDGAAATREIVDRVPDTKILVLSSSNAEPDVLEALRAGARGYLVKTGTAADVADAVQRVARGEAVFSASLAGLVLDEFRQGSRADRPALTVKQREVLRLLSQGNSYREIGGYLGVDDEAVREDVRSILALLHGEETPASPALRRDPGRGLCTVLFVDVVRSTETAARIGDQRWLGLVAQYHRLVAGAVSAHGGAPVKTAGDGVLVTFAEPSPAIEAARTICQQVTSLGLEVRIGIHMGECEITDDDVHGLAVHIGARVASKARGGQILVSQTVRDLVLGSGRVTLSDHGVHTLKGVPGRWRLFAVTEP